jgi:hypothetical protein
MSEILKVLNKNVELKSQVVELGTMQDLEKNINIVKSEESGLDSVKSKIKSQAQSAYNDLAKPLEILKDSMSKFESDAKNLGLKPSEFGSYNQAVKLMKDSNKKLDVFYSDVLRGLLK